MNLVLMPLGWFALHSIFIGLCCAADKSFIRQPNKSIDYLGRLRRGNGHLRRVMQLPENITGFSPASPCQCRRVVPLAICITVS
jgi:hypothetical protein